ncbi:MAG: hypothetical protein KDD38_04620, partial [Bdellovibrionales bacterium]|nr:hypothetical protein [Bdellovibrionales bacterium]
MLAIIFSLFVHFPLSADATGVDGFQAGIRLMQEQKFEEAAKQFETEYINGKNFAALYFNWGLSEYRLGKKGLAAALWRRALFFDPELAPASQALTFIAQELPSQFASSDLSAWATFQIKVLDRISLNKLLFLCWIFFSAAGVLLIRYWGGYTRAIKNTTPLP